MFNYLCDCCLTMPVQSHIHWHFYLHKNLVEGFSTIPKNHCNFPTISFGWEWAWQNNVCTYTRIIIITCIKFTLDITGGVCMWVVRIGENGNFFAHHSTMAYLQNCVLGSIFIPNGSLFYITHFTQWFIFGSFGMRFLALNYVWNFKFFFHSLFVFVWPWHLKMATKHGHNM